MPADRDPVFPIRLPPDLKEKIRLAAEAGHRSLTAEILLRLQQSFEPTRVSTGADVPAGFEYRLRAIEEQLGLFPPAKAKTKRRR